MPNPEHELLKTLSPGCNDGKHREGLETPLAVDDTHSMASAAARRQQCIHSGQGSLSLFCCPLTQVCSSKHRFAQPATVGAYHLLAICQFAVYNSLLMSRLCF